MNLILTSVLVLWLGIYVVFHSTKAKTKNEWLHIKAVRIVCPLICLAYYFSRNKIGVLRLFEATAAVLLTFTKKKKTKQKTTLASGVVLSTHFGKELQRSGGLEVTCSHPKFIICNYFCLFHRKYFMHRGFPAYLVPLFPNTKW